MTRIVGIAGSLRAASFNAKLLTAASYVLPRGASLTRWGGLGAVEPFDEDGEAGPEPAGVASLRRAIAEADALLIATPEYNGSIPGQLKNALDWASRPYGEGVLTGKPVAVIGASPSAYGAAWAQADLRKVLEAIGANVVDGDLAVPEVARQFDEDDRLIDPLLRSGLTDLLGRLHHHARGTLCPA
ncbi:NADPH-dependent FMN reductase [Amycolatopsis suaedae]|uniref:NAD(P)H-dependent oxidoreductase n=1 Tax=Amycolatopsis suaedae TaxID=2510978 RepID=A0A4Q7IXV9_9PSEU|nr:NAD(P)H-dependent oxidoreductase [Amycolatopsis suaedae]RZQ59790.1 NAD(P)H-dependent oxidoreductase [Amycolatopsis suaedae]